jgi:mono/diheme cytochrome c family protein
MRIRQSASETLYKAGDRSFAADYTKMASDPDVNVVIQALLAINRWKAPEASATTTSIMASNSARGVQVVGTTMLAAAETAAAGGRGRANLTADQLAQLDRGGQIYNELCFACHGPDGLGTPKPELATTMAPPLAGSPRVNSHRDYISKVVLRGLTGPVDGKSYTDTMIAMDTQSDEWIAAVASFVRNNFGNSGGFITTDDVARARGHGEPQEFLDAARVDGVNADRLFTDGWKLTASHNTEAAVGALSLTAWNAGGTQEVGMWFQVELPRDETVTEVQFQSPPPGGRAGAGNAAAVTASGAPVAGPPGFPRGYKVEVSSDGSSWSGAAEGKSNGLTTMRLSAVPAKFVRISLTAGAEDAPVVNSDPEDIHPPAGQKSDCPGRPPLRFGDGDLPTRVTLDIARHPGSSHALADVGFWLQRKTAS